METRHDFRLNFTTNQNELMTLNIPRANSTASGTQVADAMLAIINTGVVQSNRGAPTFRQSAELIRSERRDFNIFN